MIFTKYSLYGIFLFLVYNAGSYLSGNSAIKTGVNDTMPHNTSGNYALAAELDGLIASQTRDHEPGGEILVAQKGQIVYRKPFGMANMELDVPMRQNMVFHIRSLTRQMTAVAILQLMEQGKLSLQDDIRKYLPDFQALADTVTIEHLLTHTSGLPSTSVPASPGTEKTPFNLVISYKNQAPEFSAGTQYLLSAGDTVTLLKKALACWYAQQDRKNFLPMLKLNKRFSPYRRTSDSNSGETGRAQLTNLSGIREKRKKKVKGYVDYFRQAIMPIDQNT